MHVVGVEWGIHSVAHDVQVCPKMHGCNPPSSSTINHRMPLENYGIHVNRTHHRESQAVVRGVPEEIGGAHIVAMMCRFGAGMIWILEFMA